MKKDKFNIDSLRVASPCSVGWETMIGDERVRRCDSCQLNIYNTAEMTIREIESLVQEREGRLCIRLYRRADGTAITKDCPVGFRNIQKRFVRKAGVALAAIIGLSSALFAQKERSTPLSNGRIVSVPSQKQQVNISGIVTDQTGDIIPGAALKLFLDPKKQAIEMTRSSGEGKFQFMNLSDGIYQLEVSSTVFKRLIVKNINVQNGLNNELKLTMEVAGESVVVGIFAEEPLIDMPESGITYKIKIRP